VWERANVFTQAFPTPPLPSPTNQHQDGQMRLTTLIGMAPRVPKQRRKVLAVFKRSLEMCSVYAYGSKITLVTQVGNRGRRVGVEGHKQTLRVADLP
jgi:hypothetical protein